MMREVLGRWLWLWWLLLSGERERGGGMLVGRWLLMLMICDVALVVSFGSTFWSLERMSVVCCLIDDEHSRALFAKILYFSGLHCSDA